MLHGMNVLSILEIYHVCVSLITCKLVGMVTMATVVREAEKTVYLQSLSPQLQNEWKWSLVVLA